MISYISNDLIVAARRTATPVNRSVSGYGGRLPTSYMVMVKPFYWRRVYAICYSNAASLYINFGGERLFIRDEYHIAALAQRDSEAASHA